MDLGFFKDLPKMTNNHVHVFALLPYKKLLKHIRQVDPELYRKIWINLDENCPNRYAMITINDDVEGKSCVSTADRSNWHRLADLDAATYDEIANQWIVRPAEADVFAQLERIQNMFRVLIRHYKIYYYLWYISLYVNYHHNVFYLNIRSKPGSISTDVRFNERLFLDSTNIMPQQTFNEKIVALIQGDWDVPLHTANQKLLYKIYKRIKAESDIILKAVHSFNKSHAKPHYIAELPELNIKFAEKFDAADPVLMMVQYIITFPKALQQVELDLKPFLINVKMIIYVAILINREYAFPFFNGIDFVGNEQKTHELAEFIPVINKLLHFHKYGIDFIPHVGETNVEHAVANNIQRWIIAKHITRLGHAISFATTEEIDKLLLGSKIKIYVESCPISNYILGYYAAGTHPHQKLIGQKNFRLMICTDDNGVFGYSTVTKDYMFIYENWKLDLEKIRMLILNGLGVLPLKYRAYYWQAFQHLWSVGAYTNQ